MKTALMIWAGLSLFAIRAPAAPAAEEARGLVARFDLPSSPIEVRAPARKGRYFDTMARRAGVIGSEGEGFEAWVYPLKLLHDCRLSVALDGTDEVVNLGSRVEQVLVRPESVVLTATHSRFTIRQIFFTPLDQTGTILLLDVETARPMILTVSFVPDLKPMWPAGLGGQYASWSTERKLFILSESRRKYNGLIGSPAAVRGSTTLAHELAPGAVRFDLRIDPAEARRYFYPIVIAGGQAGREASYEVYDRLLKSIPAEYDNLVRHYRSIGRDFLQIRTPERELNEALEWAKVAFDKGFVDNPDLGIGLIAGWGPSGESARPGFGWFFGGDTYVNQFAISSYGAFDMMRRAFRFLQKRQRQDGKMMHELTQAASWLRWFEDYPYGYYHGDTTPFYIVALREYYRQSGDREFVRESWESLRRAYQFCKGADEDGDGLMDNTRAGLGASELGSLLEGLRTDVLLGALSPAAWQAMSEFADLMGEASLARECRALHEKALVSAREKFWNSERRSHIHALTTSGKQNPELTAWPSLGIMLGVFEGERADATAEMLASGALAADWGTRMLAATSKAYDPAAYNNGAVWPFLTGLAAAAEFVRHRGFSGYQLTLANARLTWAGAIGCHPELLSGDYYRQLETAVPHQLFSSGGVVAPLVRGLLGLTGDAPSKIVQFRPHLPPVWKDLGVRQYRLGDLKLDFLIERRPDKWRVTVEGGMDGYALDFSPALGLMTRVRSLSVNGKDAPFQLEDNGPGSQDVHPRARIPLGRRTEIELAFDPGIELDAEIEPRLPGDASRNLRILAVHGMGDTIRARLEGLGGRSYRVRIWTAMAIREVRGGRLEQGSPPVAVVRMPDTEPGRYAAADLELKMQAR